MTDDAFDTLNKLDADASNLFARIEAATQGNPAVVSADLAVIAQATVTLHSVPVITVPDNAAALSAADHAILIASTRGH